MLVETEEQHDTYCSYTYAVRNLRSEYDDAWWWQRPKIRRRAKTLVDEIKSTYGCDFGPSWGLYREASKMLWVMGISDPIAPRLDP